MSFGPEVHGNTTHYIVVLKHTITNMNFTVVVRPGMDDGTIPPESQRDNLFQAFLDILADLPNVLVTSAVKRGEFTAEVTVTP